MRIAILLPSLKNKGPVILAFDLIKHLIDKIDKLDIFYFSECSNPYFLQDLNNVNYIKISFFKPLSFIAYDIIHCHSFKPDLYTYVFKWKIKAYIVTTIHNYVYEELYYTYNIFVSKLFSRIWISSWNNKDAVVFLSKDMQQYYENKKFLNKNAKIIYNGRNVNLAQNTIQNSLVYNFILEKKQSYKIIGCCGFINKRKGFEDIIKFLTLNSNVFAVFIGEGSDQNRLIALAKSLNVFNRCSFLGHQNNSIPLINLLDVFVMSSYSEGFPLVILEAGGLGVPVLCVNSPLFRELFADDDLVFYNRNNLISMEQSLNKILENKSFYSKNIKSKINSQYSCDIMATKYFQLFNELKSK